MSSTTSPPPPGCCWRVPERSKSLGVAGWPKNLEDLRALLCEVFTPLGVPPDELTFFVNRLLVLATSCPERRLADYENVKWWDFIAAQRMSSTYQSYLGEGLTRSLVAMRAQEGSTRTVGYILLQLLYDGSVPTGSSIASSTVPQMTFG